MAPTDQNRQGAMKAFLKRIVGGRKGYDIGLYIGREHLNVVQLRPGPAGPAVRAVSSITLGADLQQVRADPRLLRRLLKQAFRRQPFSGRRVVTCLPNDLVKILLLTYPALPGVPDADSVVRELRGRVPGGLEGMVVDYLPVRQDNPSRPKEAIVAMADRDHVVAYLEMLNSAGLTVAALDIVPAALARLMSRMGSQDPAAAQNLMLVNFGSRTSYLTVVRGRGLMLDRPIEFGDERLLARLKTTLGMPDPAARQLLLGTGFLPAEPRGSQNHDLKEVLRPEFAALTAEVNKTLVYTASRTHGRTIDRMYVTGSVARYPGIERLLKEQFSVPIQILDPFSLLPHRLADTRVAELRPLSGIAAATGLALRGVPKTWPTST
ncbi:MAG: pilus assembly protein PilM [Betaproteobacteria bacterium]|nr:pilus assembly protein PilM [Betaproteobacteria bacterium]